MKICAAFISLLALAASVFAGAPQHLLDAEHRWQASGVWKVDATAGTATGTAGETLAELSAAKSVGLAGHWLSLRVALSGDAPKAGLWLGGVRDERGEGVRFVIEGASASITNGRGKTLATLAADALSKPLELTFTFTNEKVTLHCGGKEIGELAIRFAEPEATPSLFVERGKAVFSEVLLSSDATASAPAPVPLAPPARGKPAAAKPGRVVAVAPVLVVDFAAEKMTALKSGWNEYFGVHFETNPGPWKMVRQPDGPRFGLPPADRHTGDVQTMTGPFSGGKVQSSLGDFRDWQRKDSHGLDETLAQSIREDRGAIFIAPWAGPFTLAQQDEVWALMRLVYGANVGADGRVFFQWGDDINYHRLGALENVRTNSAQPHGGVSVGRNGNLPDDAVAYAERYFAPAVVAVRRASAEIFHDERHIPVLLGSCALAGRAENRAWLAQVLDHEVAGSGSPSLKGQRVSALVDVLTVNYPLVAADGEVALQELWDRYCAREGGIKALWVTEEYGTTTGSAGVMLSRAARFLAWAGKNALTAGQTRLLWNFPAHHRSNDEAAEMARMLGKSFLAEAVRIGTQEVEGGTIARIAVGDGRMLLVFTPSAERRGKHVAPIGEVVLEVGEAQAAKPWLAKPLQTTLHRAFSDKAKTTVAIRRDGTRLVLDVGASTLEPWGVLVETP